MICTSYGFGKPQRPAHVPHLIALCGFPKAGKSEVQRILSERYGVHPVDDGYALREFAQKHLGLSHDDVYTQEGKARHTVINGRTWQNRDILGSVGKQLEDLFGDHIMPWMATRNLDPNQAYSFGSVRKTQGYFFKKLGGLVIAVNNPIAKASPFAFDAFDEAAVDIWIENDGQARQLSREEGLADLEAKVVDAIESLALFRSAAQ
jgi:hypothetical protein